MAVRYFVGFAAFAERHAFINFVAAARPIQRKKRQYIKNVKSGRGVSDCSCPWGLPKAILSRTCGAVLGRVTVTPKCNTIFVSLGYRLRRYASPHRLCGQPHTPVRYLFLSTEDISATSPAGICCPGRPEFQIIKRTQKPPQTGRGPARNTRPA